ncbi:aspartate aminotransferase family protein [Variovorax sp. KK3]|uniref:aspartate aminotransferase family protein n=1 Tax=Variovorax sp. KK3 TaxID=1855728 RepID=UPI0021187FC0|nr:aspartate aminotransferase family protein [Variovorax sp. KK3]
MHIEDGIDRALGQCIDAYVDRTPESRKQFEFAQRHLPAGNTRSVLFYEPYPLAMNRGEDALLWDLDGHRYVDFLGEYTAGLYGHSNAVIRAALHRTIDAGLSLTGHNELEGRLAALICSRIASLERIRFTNSGTEANLLAVAVAKAFTRRSMVMVFEGGYHGGVLTFAQGPATINVPHDFLLARYNDIDSVDRLFERHGTEIAVVLVEPMQGAAGCIPGDPAYLEHLRQRSSEHGALLAFDEVMTSRLAPGARQDQISVRPDLTTLGKYIGGGMSCGAFGGRSDIMDLFDPRRKDALPHAGTFNNNVMSMAAGIAGLEQVFTPDACIDLNAKGDALRDRLNGICAQRRLPFQFSGLGSTMNFHPTGNAIRSTADLRSCDTRFRDLFFFSMLEQGIYVARRGFVVLSLPTTLADIDRFAEAFDNFADKCGPLLG